MWLRRATTKKRFTFNNCDFFFFPSEDLNAPWDHAEAEEDSKVAVAKWLFSVNASLWEGSSPREAAFNAPTG